MTRDGQTRWPLREALKTAQAILDQDSGMIEGCIALSACAHQVVPDWPSGPDFVVFCVIASSTDHLPFEEVRARWSASALAKADPEIAAINDTHRESVCKACENVITRFSPGKRTVTLYRPVGPIEHMRIGSDFPFLRELDS